MFATRGTYPSSSNTSLLSACSSKMFGCSFVLDCHLEPSKHNLVDLEEFPALTKSKPISFTGAALKKSIVMPIEDFTEVGSAENDCSSVSKKKRFRRKKKQNTYNEGNTSDDNESYFFPSDEVKDADMGQLSLSENKFDFLKSRSRLNVLRNITAKCASKSPVVVDVSSLQVEDEGFAEELVECTNPISVYHSLPTNKSGVVVSHFGHPPLQAKSSHESQIATSSCLSQCANDEVSTLSVNHSASNSMKPHTKYPVKGRTLTNIRPHISEQHARSTSPSHLFDTYSPSKSTNDFIDEDDMEGTDLLHLISNSLDRFNAIVHPQNNMSTLTSGLGESSGILSETSCCSQSQDCLFPTDIVTKPSTMLLFADKDYKRNVSIDCRVLNNFCQTSVSSLNSDVKRTSRLLETNDPKNLNSVAPETMSISSKCNTSCPSFGHLPLSLPYSYANEFPIDSCQPVEKKITYYPSYSSAVPRASTSSAGVVNPIAPGSSMLTNNSLMDRSKSCWSTVLTGGMNSSKMPAPSFGSSNSPMTDLINNNRNVLTDNDIDMLSYLNLDLECLLTAAPIVTTKDSLTANSIAPVDHPLHHRHHQHFSNDINQYDEYGWNIGDDNKCKSMNLFNSSAEDENVWNSNKSVHPNISMLKTQSLIKQPLRATHQTLVSSLPSNLLLQHPTSASATSINAMKYERSNDSERNFINPSDNGISVSTKCINIPNNRNGKIPTVLSHSFTSVNGSTGWSAESSCSLPCNAREILLAAQSNSTGYHQNISARISSSSCPTSRTPPTVSMNHPFTSTMASFGGLPLLCNSSAVRNSNGLQEGYRNINCRRHNNSLNLKSGNNSVSSMPALNSLKSSTGLTNTTSNSHLSGSKSLTHCYSNSQRATTTTDSLSLCPGAELVNGKPVVAKWRRACSFYLRGHCKKEDCEFAHDLTKVTCKFWEMGECFKGSTCPFLHGYPPELNVEQQ